VRFLSCWYDQILPVAKSGQTVLIVAHQNSLRALIKHLDNLSDEDITALDIPTANPLVYELNQALQPIRHYYLGGNV
jgi:2,3-bisphosphoglycerate-dependent phosphoglycerate mutase